MEIGSGDCLLSLEVCKSTGLVYAADVCESISRNHPTPANFKLLIFDGIVLPVPARSVDLVYSNQVLEHLHPEDLVAHLESIYRSLNDNGCFVCVTPSRVGGPWDISFHFDRDCRGLHMREYTYHDLVKMLHLIGFRNVVAFVGGQGVYWSFPLCPILWLERILEAMPWFFQSRLARTAPLRAFLGIRLAATK
jgi:SAM-dependent methyltransferase